MEHHVLEVTQQEKPAVIRELAKGKGSALFFTRTKFGAERLAKQLTQAGVPAVDLHGNLGQGARARNLAAFSSKTVRVLVATDIAARGIHVDDISLVVHVDPPVEHKAYLHRSGRTARAGAAGLVVTIATPNQRRSVRTLTHQAGVSPTTSQVGPTDRVVVDLIGERADLLDPEQAAKVVADAQTPPVTRRPMRGKSSGGYKGGFKGPREGGSREGGARRGGYEGGARRSQHQ
jgi:superfamily II DNA/RNA helicase